MIKLLQLISIFALLFSCTSNSNEEIDWRLEQAKILEQHHRYNDSKELLEEVLFIDPYNSEAAKLLIEVNDQIYILNKWNPSNLRLPNVYHDDLAKKHRILNP